MKGKGRQYRMNINVFQAASTGDSSYFGELTNPNSILLQVTTEKNTVLHIALQFENFEAAKKIVYLCPSLVFQTNSNGNTPLHVAARVGSSSMVKLLIQEAKKLDVETGGIHKQLLSMANLDGDTALHVAVQYDKFDVGEELIKEDPELAKSVNKAGESALFLAVDKEHYEMASHILIVAPDCSYAGRHGMNVLHALVLHTCCYINKGNFLSPKKIESYGQPSISDRCIVTCAWVVSMLYTLRIPESDLRTDTVLNRTLQRTFGTIPEDLMKEVMKKWPPTIEQGDDAGWTPLHIAAQIGNEKCVKLLLQNDNSPGYIKNKEGLSALHIAAKNCNVNVMEELFTACPDISELLNNKGQTALHVAAESGQLKAVRCFMKRPEFKGLVNQQDEEGNTPMHLAAINDHILVVSRLGNCRDVVLNARNKEGFTMADNIFLTTSLNNSFSKELWGRGARPSLRGALLKMGITNLDPRRKSEPASDGNGKVASVSDFRKEVSETNLLVATLIATVTFAAAFTVPGGYNQNGRLDEGLGLAVLSKRSAFCVFLMANTLAFGLSTTSIFVHFLASATFEGDTFPKEVVQRAPPFTNWSIKALLVAFIAGTYTVVPHYLGITVAVILCCCFLSSMFVPYSIKKY